jgi:tetratricopeptide (TPR) repeat protein
MRTIDRELLAKTTRRLRAVVNAKSSERADARLFRLCTRAVRSEQPIEAVFAAVQLMRDLDKIDRAEGAFILWRLFDQLLWNELCTSTRKPDPDFDRAWREGVELDLIIAANNDRETVRAAAFLRDHGEEELADMLLNRPDEYEALWVEGEGMLVGDKPPEERPAAPATSPAATQVFSECILALAATEAHPEWFPAWMALHEASKAVAPADAVAAIQSLRDAGGVSYEESVSLIQRALDPLINETLEADREYRRLDRALEAFDETHRIDTKDGVADGVRPVEWQVLRHRHRRRFDGITAVVLRRFGERRSANLLTRNPQEYDRLCDKTVGGRRG